MRLLKDRWLSRRTVLRGAGVSVALPWLEAMSPRKRALAAGPTKRFVYWFSPNGTIKDAWVPPAGATETEFSLSRILAPLEAYKSHLTILDGIDNVVAQQPSPGDGHMKGMACMLTGVDLLPGKILGGSGTPAGLSSGLSVDQEIVQKTKPNTRFPSLELGVQSGAQGTPWGYANYKGSNQPLPLDNSPLNVWNRIFAEVGANPADNSLYLRAGAQKRAVLDAVMANHRTVTAKLGADDKKRLDQHLNNISELQRRLGSAAIPPLAKSCVKPEAPDSKFLPRSNDNFPAAGKLQMDLLAMALQCDLTRVATLQWEHSVGGIRFSWDPILAVRGHHDMSHDPDTELATKEILTKINVWFMEQLAYLAGKLRGVQEEGGTLLDNVLILGGNELARGNAHSHTDMPLILLGKAGGKVRSGRYLKFTGTVPHNDLLTTLLNVFDVPAAKFGRTDICRGPLGGLT
jgi:hypothetical protein